MTLTRLDESGADWTRHIDITFSIGRVAKTLNTESLSSHRYINFQIDQVTRKDAPFKRATFSKIWKYGPRKRLNTCYMKRFKSESSHPWIITGKLLKMGAKKRCVKVEGARSLLKRCIGGHQKSQTGERNATQRGKPTEG